MSTPLLDIRGLTVRFATRHGAFTAVDGVDIGVEPNEVLAIVGESGSGKSVAMLAIMGLLPWTATVTAERMAGNFCRRHLASLLSAIAVSILAAIGMVSEFFFITKFLHIELSISQTIAAWTAGWLAFLVPLPGGLGALEASQVFALGAFGISAASAISVTFLIRGRDLLIGGLGLLFAGRGVK